MTSEHNNYTVHNTGSKRAAAVTKRDSMTSPDGIVMPTTNGKTKSVSAADMDLRSLSHEFSDNDGSK